MKNATNHTLIYALIFIFFVSVFILFSNGRYGGDGLESYLTAESIVLDGDITIHDRPFGVKEMSYPAKGRKDAAGKHYSPYSIGMPIILIPFYALGHMISKFIPQIPHDYLTQFCVSFVNPVITAFIALVLFIFLGRLGFSLKTRFLTTLCYSFCTMSLIYTRSGFSEPALGLLVLLVMLFLYSYEQTGSFKYLLFVGILLGYAVFVKKNAFLYFPLIFFYLMRKTAILKPHKSFTKLWLISIIPLSLFALIYLFYYTGIAGSVNTGGWGEIFSVLVKEKSIYGCRMLKGLFYYLLSPGKGYFFYNIPLLLAVFGVKGLLNKKREMAVYLLTFIIINLLCYGYIFVRGSLFSWGPRYLYPTIPLMCIFLAEFIENSKSAVKKFLLAICCILGFLIQLPCLFISFTKYLFFVKQGLGLPEYFINFIAELSPIKGVWHLFISAINRQFGGSSLLFEYNPDAKFIEPIARSLESYDIWDIWWVNALKISPRLFPIVVFVLLFLGITAIICFTKLQKLTVKKI